MIHIFVINHFAGSKHLALNLRKHLKEKKDIKYFVFNTVEAGYEEKIVRKIKKYFEGEKLRFYCCGGSGTMRNMLNGFESFSDIEVAFFPCGLTNDFLKNFGADEELFKDIDNLIDGEVINVDYIKTSHGVALNTISVGYDTNTVLNMKTFRAYDLFGSSVPYILSSLGGVVFAKPRKMKIIIDGVESSKRFSEVIFGNGGIFGGNLHFGEITNVVDGMASYFTAVDIRGLKSAFILFKMIKKKLGKLGSNVSLGECHKMEFKAIDYKPLFINFDGELVECGDYCCAEIIKQGLPFVVPKGVKPKTILIPREAN